VDVYDVRVGGGLASQHQATPQACSGEACRPAPAPAPAPPLAASVTFNGPGNAKPGAVPANVSVATHAVHGASFLIDVRVPVGGLITISGSGVRTARKTVAKAGAYRLRVTLTAKEKRALEQGRRLELKLRATFTPPAGASSAAAFSVTVKSATHARRARRATNATRRKGK
jgi:hypothetical protein